MKKSFLLIVFIAYVFIFARDISAQTSCIGESTGETGICRLTALSCLWPAFFDGPGGCPGYLGYCCIGQEDVEPSTDPIFFCTEGANGSCIVDVDMSPPAGTYESCTYESGGAAQNYCQSFSNSFCENPGALWGYCQDCSSPLTCESGGCTSGSTEISEPGEPPHCANPADYCCQDEGVEPPPPDTCHECIPEPYFGNYCVEVARPEGSETCDPFFTYESECENACINPGSYSCIGDPYYYCTVAEDGEYTGDDAYADCQSECYRPNNPCVSNDGEDGICQFLFCDTAHYADGGTNPQNPTCNNNPFINEQYHCCVPNSGECIGIFGTEGVCQFLYCNPSDYVPLPLAVNPQNPVCSENEFANMNSVCCLPKPDYPPVERASANPFLGCVPEYPSSSVVGGISLAAIAPPNQCIINTAIGCVPVQNLTPFSSFLLRFSLGIGGGIAFLLIAYAGIIISSSTGNPYRLKSGKELLWAAITGLALLVCSAYLLHLIGVDILRLPGF